MASQLWWYSARAGGIGRPGRCSLPRCCGASCCRRSCVRRACARLGPSTSTATWVAWPRSSSAVHVGSIILDSYTHFGLGDVLVPFASAVAPLAVAWGIVGHVLVAGGRAHVAGSPIAVPSGCGDVCTCWRSRCGRWRRSTSSTAGTDATTTVAGPSRHDRRHGWRLCPHGCPGRGAPLACSLA